MRLRLRDAWEYLFGLPIVIGVIWVCTQLFPDDIRVNDVGSLIVTGSMYFILVAVIILMVFLFTMYLINMRAAYVISLLFSLFAGAPVLYILDNFSGFRIGDPFLAFLISFISASITIGCEYAVLRHR